MVPHERATKTHSIVGRRAYALKSRNEVLSFSLAICWHPLRLGREDQTAEIDQGFSQEAALKQRAIPSTQNESPAREEATEAL